ncbi:MAG: GNAT family N-acetyltransferase [Bacillaceae bacterium]|nr:GNAT family N-acetyltransferase [Bacillaceae bacterium]
MNFNRIRILNENDLQELKFIANVHEELPTGWIKDYVVNPPRIEETFHRLIRKQHGHSVFCGIVEDNNTIISFVWAERNEKNSAVLDIMSLWTDQMYRRQGLATMLKLELEKWAQNQQGIREIHTTVSKENKKMMS